MSPDRITNQISFIERQIDIKPVVLRDDRGQIRWSLPGNTKEENEQLRIHTIQALFIDRFPEFEDMFPRRKDGRIVEDKREEAAVFVIERLHSQKAFNSIIGGFATRLPYFEGRYQVAITKSFQPWGLQFNLEPLEGWLTASSLARELDCSWDLIRRMVNRFKDEHPEQFKPFYVDKIRKRYEHLSPDLVFLITEELKNRSPQPEGWLTRKALAKKLKVSSITISRRVEGLRINHPEWFGVYLDSAHKPEEHYSPELVAIIADTLSKHEPAPEGWIIKASLTQNLNLAYSSINRLISGFRVNHPDWFMTYLDQSGRPQEHYSIELAAEIKKLAEAFIHTRRKTTDKTISPEKANEQLRRLLEE